MYQPNPERYRQTRYVRLGRSGVQIAPIALGLWQNFGDDCRFDVCRDTLCAAFDAGVNHFDLANNYGIPAGAAERTFGRVLHGELGAYRDELFISTKAGYTMWDGPFGDHGSKKYLIASLDQSLKRMGLEYVDLFYHHRPDADTPLEETAEALEQIVRQGKALYIGLSNYNAAQTEAMLAELERRNLHCLIHQMRYSMFSREAETSLFATLRDHGVASIAFSPLAQGLLTNKYLGGIPEGSRMSLGHTSLKAADLTQTRLDQLNALNGLAAARGQTLAQMALSWVLRDGGADALIVGARNPEQLADSLSSLRQPDWSPDERAAVEAILAQ
ncbi:MAG TPA: aldo/keto reductase [Candidatus Limiplasma sp.]|nr:aldo/keto reductase [Candidatus Limiplasma sp.]HPS82445.1 aldo/keto reductase [Candidatus Limiplasma sp.]